MKPSNKKCGATGELVGSPLTNVGINDYMTRVNKQGCDPIDDLYSTYKDGFQLSDNRIIETCPAFLPTEPPNPTSNKRKFHLRIHPNLTHDPSILSKKPRDLFSTV